ncbi:hypothetical protein GCK32_018719 [Trichostrongylus colubriformis]|uniref:Uncharacterized protein n=1 Tax=Trichostrongylus colubriformis TaxID=6319 RepID=A0AAN8EVL2_TRICO
MLRQNCRVISRTYVTLQNCCLDCCFHCLDSGIRNCCGLLALRLYYIRRRLILKSMHCSKLLTIYRVALFTCSNTTDCSFRRRLAFSLCCRCFRSSAVRCV